MTKYIVTVEYEFELEADTLDLACEYAEVAISISVKNPQTGETIQPVSSGYEKPPF